jgi:uncharacterized protein with HEPN domain
MRPEVFWLRDMVLSCHLVSEYIDGQTYESFAEDMARRDAVCYRLAVIGEAVGQVFERAGVLLPAVPWEEIKRMRNLLVHDFFQIDVRTVWRTAAGDVPQLLEALRTVVRPEE